MCSAAQQFLHKSRLYVPVVSKKIRTVVPPHKVHSLPQPRVPRIKVDNTGIMSTMKRVPQPPLHRMGSSTAGAVVLNGVWIPNYHKFYLKVKVTNTAASWEVSPLTAHVQCNFEDTLQNHWDLNQMTFKNLLNLNDSRALGYPWRSKNT